MRPVADIDGSREVDHAGKKASHLIDERGEIDFDIDFLTLGQAVEVSEVKATQFDEEVVDSRGDEGDCALNIHGTCHKGIRRLLLYIATNRGVLQDT